MNMSNTLNKVLADLTKQFGTNSVSLYKDMEVVDVKRVSS